MYYTIKVKTPRDVLYLVNCELIDGEWGRPHLDEDDDTTLHSLNKEFKIEKVLEIRPQEDWYF
jgi:hypothetical protein